MDKLFFMPARNDRVLFFDRIQLVGLYTMSILSIIATVLNLPMDIADGSTISVVFMLIFIVLILAGLISFWITRNLTLAQWFMGAAILLIMTNVIISAGGRYGLGALYFMAGFSILYLLVNFTSGVILPIFYTVAMIIRLLIGNFHPDNIFSNPEILSRFMVVLILSGLFGILASISQHSVVKHISRLAFEDFITGLPNRNKLQEILKSRIVQAVQQEDTFSLVAIRLLNFSRLNGYIGTGNGDKILQSITKRLEQLLNSFIGRWSGSIFMTLIPDNDAIKVKEICKKIMQRLSQTYTISDNHVTAQFIISVSRYPNDASHPTQLLSNTISLLDHTKRMAGDIVFYDEETLKKEQFRFLLKEAMSQADMDQEFTLVYQPKIRLADESCVGAEALLRWKNKDLGVIPPDIFIPVAEETGYIKKITRWVISRALKDIEQLCSKTGKDKEKFNIAINLSVMDINDPDFITFIEAQTKMSKVSMSCIEFELTERIQMDQDPQIQQTLSRLNEMGFRIAIDDFGTGYSSLSYLHQMNANNLKIDKSFITKIENSAHVNSYPVVDAVISMGSSMGLEVTAEGVETKEQAIYLSKQGCDTAQGWFYAKAVSMEDFIKYVSQ